MRQGENNSWIFSIQELSSKQALLSLTHTHTTWTMLYCVCVWNNFVYYFATHALRDRLSLSRSVASPWLLPLHSCTHLVVAFTETTECCCHQRHSLCVAHLAHLKIRVLVNFSYPIENYRNQMFSSHCFALVFVNENFPWKKINFD